MQQFFSPNFFTALSILLALLALLWPRLLMRRQTTMSFWLRTFHYKVDTNSKLEASDNYTILSELHVLKAKDDKLILNSDSGQIVTVSGRKFHLLVIKAGRQFRIWMRDATTDEVFVAMAREAEAVFPVPSSSTAAFSPPEFRYI